MSAALEGEHLCLQHQGNHSHYDSKNCRICQLESQLERKTAVCNQLKDSLVESLLRESTLKAQLPKWISVEDKNPVTDFEVLALTKSGEYFLADYSKGAWCETTEGIEIEDVTHWMHLPQKDE